MRRNLNLELQLFPPSHSDLRPINDEEEARESQQQDHSHQQQQQHRPLTIFYGGKTCVRDVTEIQARSILMVAHKEIMEERVRTPTATTTSTGSSPVIPQSHQNLNSPCTSHYMQKSLQRFLQKRKNRAQEASPYNVRSNEQNHDRTNEN
ncbi:protein TIFY 5A-like [Lotus japonicus]|uniref:protein TIFY 5A-like n=1 Tax=Lotus japonicus TaxID=34305 RepID=UPI002589B215|nr:protein TIFY 5A-like [Lotus japonicus]